MLKKRGQPADLSEFRCSTLAFKSETLVFESETLLFKSETVVFEAETLVFESATITYRFAALLSSSWFVVIAIKRPCSKDSSCFPVSLYRFEKSSLFQLNACKNKAGKSALDAIIENEPEFRVTGLIERSDDLKLYIEACEPYYGSWKAWSLAVIFAVLDWP